jgi:hypothetical protein
MSKADAELTGAPARLWHLFNERRWDETKELLSPDEFEAYWPQTKEKIVGRDNFIEVNRRYPGEHKIEFVDSHYVYDRWDHTYKVTTQVYIESKMPDGSEMKLYAVSIWDLDHEGVITGALECWADCSEPPVWRKDLAERTTR